MGYKTTPSGNKRHWHFAVSAQPAVHPEPLLKLKAHVLFSDDAVHLWGSQRRMHRARRGQCKGWWNDDWRDRLLATMTWLSQGADEIPLPLGQSVFGHLSIRPIQFISPVSLNEQAREEELAGDESVGDEEPDDLENGSEEQEGA